MRVVASELGEAPRRASGQRLDRVRHLPRYALAEHREDLDQLLGDELGHAPVDQALPRRRVGHVDELDLPACGRGELGRDLAMVIGSGPVWAKTPARFTPLESEPLVRLLIADLVGEAVTRASVATLRDDIAELSAQRRPPR